MSRIPPLPAPPPREAFTVSKEEMRERCRLASGDQPTRRTEALLRLPLKRDIQLGGNSMGQPRLIDLRRAVNIEAALIQLTGTEADAICGTCTRLSGPFQGCVVSTELAACASCHYNGKDARCSFYHERGPAPQQLQELSSTAARDNKNGNKRGWNSPESNRPEKRPRPNISPPALPTTADRSSASLQGAPTALTTAPLPSPFIEGMSVGNALPRLPRAANRALAKYLRTWADHLDEDFEKLVEEENRG